METDAEEADTSHKTSNGVHWTDIKQFQHKYLVEVPHDLKKNLEINIELPSPVFDPIQVSNYTEYAKLFKPKEKVDTRLNYYKKLYASDKKIVQKMIKENKFLHIPQYVLDVSQGVFENCDDQPWYYTGGTLDILSIDHRLYIVRAGLNHPVYITDVNDSASNVHIDLDGNAPIYNLRVASRHQNNFLITRQKRQVSLYFVRNNDEKFDIKTAWKTVSGPSMFIDTAFNELKDNEISVINSDHKLRVVDFINKTDTTSYSFTEDFSNLADNFAQINYIDINTVAYINRSCVYLLDLRSLDVNKSCLKTTWLKCDDLCGFSRSCNLLYLSSLHNVIKFDLRAMKFTDRMMHMLSTPPLILNIAEDDGDYICLSGHHVNDKVLLHSSDMFSTPMYVPNTKDTLIAAGLTRSLNLCGYLEERLCLPTIGIKLYKDDACNDLALYTLNSVGDVFKQKVSREVQLNFENAEDALVKWSDMILYTPKALEATNICNLDNIMHTISSRFPDEKKLRTIMKEENLSQKEFEKELFKLSKQLENSVGGSMNSIWDDDKVITEDDANKQSTMTSKHKVSEWLDSVV